MNTCLLGVIYLFLCFLFDDSLFISLCITDFTRIKISEKKKMCLKSTWLYNTLNKNKSILLWNWDEVLLQTVEHKVHTAPHCSAMKCALRKKKFRKLANKWLVIVVRWLCLLCLMTYQLHVSYLMSKFDHFCKCLIITITII